MYNCTQQGYIYIYIYISNILLMCIFTDITDNKDQKYADNSEKKMFVCENKTLILCVCAIAIFWGQICSQKLDKPDKI